MASVSNIGSDPSVTALYLQEVQALRAKQTESASQANAAGGSLLDLLGKPGGPPKISSELKNKINAAVQETVAGLPPNTSFADAVQAIQETIEKTLKENGIDPTSLSKPQDPAIAAAEQQSQDLLNLLKQIFANDGKQAGGTQDLFSVLTEKDKSPLGGAADAGASSKLLDLLQNLPTGFNLDTHA